MRKFCYKRWVKIIAFILCIISFNVAVGSFYVMMIGETEGLYENTEEEFRERIYDAICNKYSIAAITAYQDGFRMEELKDTNFRYGVIQTDDITDLDLNERTNYEVCNFDKDVTEDMLYVHTYSMGKSTGFYVGESLFDNFYVYNSGESHVETRNLIEAYYYARDVDKFYCKAGNRLYPVLDYAHSWYRDEIEPVTTEEGDREYVWQDDQEQIEFGDQIWYLSDIEILLRKDLDEIGTIVSENMESPDYEDYYIENGYVVIYSDELHDTKPYYVLSYVNEPLKHDGFFNRNIFGKLDNWERQDYFVQAEFLLRTAYAVRYGLFGIFIVSLILFLLSFAVLLTGAGHRNTEEIIPGWMEWIPFDLYLIGMLGIGGVLVGIAVETLVYMSVRMFVQFGFLYLITEEVLFLLCSVSTVVRIKQGTWWKNTICFRIWDKCCHFVKSSLKKFGQAAPMLWKAWIVMAALAFLEMMGILMTSYHPEIQIFLWFFEKVILYALITMVLLQMKKLQQTGEELALGKLKSKLDTSGMFFDFKEHGKNLNNIQDGIKRAVEEQMKSEHFKTELITNVSHDIKTPLTSIINYVDLLEKEKIENENVQEYLEVLSRQSARLKKLIEDLMEASKASTGNLNVIFERCDAHVMLIQTIGEFEEKLKAGQIELIVQGSSEPLFIQADPRHLWRIFDNMMNNICKYAQPSTRAYVNIEKPGQSGKIIFRNISKYALNISSEELMERFVRGDSSRNTEGSGLGLSIAKSLTELMQGTFELVVDGDLFKVIITFPISEDVSKE